MLCTEKVNARTFNITINGNRGILVQLNYNSLMWLSSLIFTYNDQHEMLIVCCVEQTEAEARNSGDLTYIYVRYFWKLNAVSFELL